MLLREWNHAMTMNDPSKKTVCGAKFSADHLPGATGRSSVCLSRRISAGRTSDLPQSDIPSVVFRLVLVLLLATGICGCTTGLLNMPKSGMFSGMSGKDGSAAGKKKDRKKDKSDDDDEDNDFGDKIETPLLKDYISVQGNNAVVLRGVGLVTRLNGTGDDPPPSALYSALKQEMSRRGILDQRKILSSKDTALVVVTAYLPAMVRKDQRFDVTVAVPPNSDAKSLKGGWLLETRLFEEQNVEGRGSLKGHEYAIASGAILTQLGIEKDPTTISAELRRGSIPGGAISKTERDLSILLKNDKRGFRNAKRIATAVSERFNHYNRFGQRIPLAEAKTDGMMTLKVHPSYRNNFPRYQQVIRSIAFNEGEVARRVRMESLEKEILKPSGAQNAALQLEAIGTPGIPFLKRALESSDFEVQFHAAQALAYLGDASGVDVLRNAVETQPALRVYALAAMSVVDDPEAILTLRELMSADQLETRYGALRALQELDPNDPSLHCVEFEHQFKLYLIESTGEPMSHVTRRRTAEVVLFGATQQLRLPAILNAGRYIRVIGESGSREVVITKYSLSSGEPVRRTTSNKLGEILAACGELGATYPDIVQLMIEAEQQHNIEGQLGIDRLPQAGRMLVRRDFVADGTAEDEKDVDDSEVKDSDKDDEKSGKDSKDAKDKDSEEDEDDDAEGKRIGNPSLIPNMFDKLDEQEIRQQESDEKLNALRFEDVSDADPEQAVDGAEADSESPVPSATPEGHDKSAAAENGNGLETAQETESESSAAADGGEIKSSDSTNDTEAASEPDSSKQSIEDSGTADNDDLADDTDAMSDTDAQKDTDAEDDAFESERPGLGQRFRNLFRRGSDDEDGE